MTDTDVTFHVRLAPEECSATDIDQSMSGVVSQQICEVGSLLAIWIRLLHRYVAARDRLKINTLLRILYVTIITCLFIYGAMLWG